MYFKAELANVQQQLQQNETEAVDAIARWQQNGIELEEKCAHLEDKLEAAVASLELVDDSTTDSSNIEDSQLREQNISLQQKNHDLETSLAQKTEVLFRLRAENNDAIVELQEALATAQDTLSKDEEVVQQWEGKFKKHRFVSD